MYRIFFIITLFSLLITTSIQAQFEPAEVEKSEQKVLLKGKVYYIHTVKPNQTLYSISRAYGVTEQDIATANPNILLEVIKPGLVLKIPENSKLADLSESYFGLSPSDFIIHTVQPQQTLYYLSKKYDVPEELIIKFNPGSGEVLQIGQVVKIPKKKVVKKLKKTIKEKQEPRDTSNTCLVKEGDTLYSLANRFGVSVADFIELNPELRWGLKAGMILKIPIHSPFDEVYVFSQDTLDTLKLINLFNSNQCDSIEQNKKNEQIKIVLMLPFHTMEIEALDTISNDSIKKVHPYNRYKRMGRSFADFYKGFLIAIDSIKKRGVNITLFTYDTRSDTVQIQKIITELEIIRPDFIVGPVNSQNIARISKFSFKNKIPVILPFSRNNINQFTGNPYLIYMMPDSETEITRCADFLTQYSSDNIILIHNADSLNQKKIDEFKNTLFSYFASKSAYENLLYKEFKINDSLQSNIELALRSDLNNLVLLISSKEAEVVNVIRQLNMYAEDIPIKLFGLPAWRKFDNLRIDQLHNLNTIVYSPFYIDYSKSYTKNFIKYSRKFLKSEPYKIVSSSGGFNLTYLGYETAMIFSTTYLKYGSSFINCLCNVEQPMPQSIYTFKYIRSGGFSNNSISFILYKDDYDIIGLPYNSEKNSSYSITIQPDSFNINTKNISD